MRLYSLQIEHVVQTEMSGHKRERVMPNEINSGSEKAQPLVYQIRIQGQLGREWTDWFGGLTIRLTDNGETLLTGPVCVKPGEAEASDVKQ